MSNSEARQIAAEQIDDDPDPWLTCAECVRDIGPFTIQTYQRACKLGRIPFRKVGHILLIRRSTAIAMRDRGIHRVPEMERYAPGPRPKARKAGGDA